LRKKVSKQEARALRPAKLEPVEPELRVPRPRPMVWVARKWSHGKITPERRELLVDGLAARAWVTHEQTTSDREGPDIFARFAYEHGDELYQGQFFGSYDAMHLAIGFPDFAAWLGRAIRPGGTLTVLFPEDDPSKYAVYGSMELYIEKSLVDVLAEHEAASDEEKSELLEVAARLLRGPIGPLRGDDWFEYFEQLSKISGMATNDRTTLFEVADAAIEAIASGEYDRSPIGRLSRICSEYMPGVWAAR
jgi:hypothetical protein